MRKGRTSRRSRVSRPLVGVKAPAVDTLTDAASAPSPRVVVGVPPSDPPPSEGAPTSEVLSEAPDSLEARSEAPSGASSGPVSRSFAETLIGGSRAETPEPPSIVPVTTPEGTAPSATTNIEARATIALGSTTEPKPTSPEAASEKPEATKAETMKAETTKKLAGTLAFGSADVTPTPVSPVFEPKRSVEADTQPLALASRPAPVPIKAEPVPVPVKVEPKAAARVDRSEKSEPSAAEEREAVPAEEPSADHAVDEKFFSEGDISVHAPPDSPSEDALPPLDKMRRKAEPQVVERRARFVRYVKWAVGGAAIVCLAAMLRTTLAPAKPPAPAPTPVAATPEPPTTPKAAESAAAPVAAEPASAPPASAEAPPPSAGADPAAAAPSASAAASAAASAVASAAPAEPPTGDPKEEKLNARKLLERRKIAEAIEAGEKSVALDPTDGEAWLILGAAYQEKGQLGEARRAYASCVKEGKTGPRHECAKMLR